MEKLIFTPAKDPIEVPCGSEVAVGTVTTAPYFRAVGFACTKEGMDRANAFARRLVAAYNACAGIETEMLEIPGMILSLNITRDSVKLERLKAVNAQLTDALEEARLQIECLHGKFKATGSGNAVLQRINSVLSAYSSQKT